MGFTNVIQAELGLRRALSAQSFPLLPPTQRGVSGSIDLFRHFHLIQNRSYVDRQGPDPLLLQSP
jgi:hypothetical protein